jgi:Xaa-Pro aminopeptidase
MNPNPPLDIDFLSTFLRECRWMRKSKDWKERLLSRLAQAHLDVLTQQALEKGSPGLEEKSWQGKVRK